MEKRGPEAEAGATGRGRRFGIVAARFNADIVDRLLAGAVATLGEHGVDEGDVAIVRVPGSWEIPQALGMLAAARRFDALIALGAVIRGETDHYDHICAECSRGCARVAHDSGVPVAFGVLTCATVELAAARAGGSAGNKGAEAAAAAVEMATLRQRLAASSGEFR